MSRPMSKLTTERSPRRLSARGPGRAPGRVSDMGNTRPRSQCTVIENGERCPRPAHGKGYCGKHYQRWQSHNDPLVVRPFGGIQVPPEERFWSKVNKDGSVPDYAPHLGPCWTWDGTRNAKGYGVLTIRGRVGSRLAHVLAWEFTKGLVPEGLELDHLCRVKHCVNVDLHLEPVTHAENVRRGSNAMKTHCPRGHPYDEANTHYSSNGRKCRECNKQRCRLRAQTQAFMAAQAEADAVDS